MLLKSFLTDQNTTAFKEVAIIRHPRVGEYAFGFITSTVTLQVCEADEVMLFSFPSQLAKCIQCRIKYIFGNGDISR